MNCQKFKQTKIGKAISINSKRELKKGTIAKKVSMDKLNTFDKNIQGFEIIKYAGGSKFINGDTLLARITPCLENGKTAYVDFLDEKEIGFGSTEFIVLSGKEGETTNEFVYYLAISPRFREQAISSMTGTSGRQRVQTDFLELKEIILPPLPEQLSIAKILSSLDEKIELNNKMNKTLEAIGQALFKKWFIDHPKKEEEEEKIAENLFKLEYGWHLPEWDRQEGQYPVFGSGGLTGTHNKFFVEGPGIILGRAGKIGSKSVYYSAINFCPIETTFYIKTDYKKNIPFIYFFLKNLEMVNTGSSVPNLSRRDIHNLLMKIPSKKNIDKFYEIINKTLEKKGSCQLPFEKILLGQDLNYSKNLICTNL